METSLPDNIRFTCQASHQKNQRQMCEKNPAFQAKVIYQNIHVVLVLGVLQACDCIGLFIHSNLF